MVLIAAFGLAASAASPAPAATPAPSKPTFSLSSGKTNGAIKLRGARGAQLRNSVQVRNLSKRQVVTVRLQPADVRNATNGNADYATTRLGAAGRWLDLDRTAVRLAPGSTRRIGFTVSVPANARGASHYAGIVAVDASELATVKATRNGGNSAGFNISRINRQALPLTVRLPGPLTRELSLREVTLDVKPSGAALVLALRPGGSVLMQSARVKLRVSRGDRTVLTDDTTLGQLFPGSGLDYRIPWEGQPTEGGYRVTGVIRPDGADDVIIDQTVEFTSDKVAELKTETPPGPATPGLPLWVWLALGTGATLLVGMSVALFKLRRRPVPQVA